MSFEKTSRAPAGRNATADCDRARYDLRSAPDIPTPRQLAPSDPILNTFQRCRSLPIGRRRIEGPVPRSQKSVRLRDARSGKKQARTMPLLYLLRRHRGWMPRTSGHRGVWPASDTTFLWPAPGLHSAAVLRDNSPLGDRHTGAVHRGREGDGIETVLAQVPLQVPVVALGHRGRLS